MEIVESEYIVDAMSCRIGQSATLVRVDSDEDGRRLLENILESGYYDTTYFAEKSAFKEAGLTLNLWFVASLASALRPTRSIEMGAGRGDVVAILRAKGIEADGVDFSADMYERLPASIRDHYHFGDVAEVAAALVVEGARFDTVIGLDIWEHLLPAQIDTTLANAVDLLADDGMYLAVVPAFGRDRVFGEIFPLEFEENRARFDAGQPFDHLTLERTNPPIPAAGHLTWAPTDWWEQRVTATGLIREERIEARLHAIFDPYLPHSNRCFYVFRRDTDAARARADDVAHRLETRPVRLQRWRNLAALGWTGVRGTHRWAVSPLDYVADRNRGVGVARTLVTPFRRVWGRLTSKR